jgi:hypothetical protein
MGSGKLFLAEAQKKENESARLWPKFQIEAQEWNPVALFTKCLLMCLNKSRLVKVLSSYQGKDIKQQINQIFLNHRLVEFLNSLDEREIIKIADALMHDNKNLKHSLEIGTGRIELILSSLGVYTGTDISFIPYLNEKKEDKRKKLQDKIARDDFDVFIAYNNKDESSVLDICKYLMQEGIYPWIDVEQIPPGQWFQEIIQTIIPKVKSACIFLGVHGVGRWEALELRTFVSQCIEQSIPIIPVLLPMVQEIPKNLLFLRELNWVQFQNKLEEKDAIYRLVWGITGKKVKNKGNTGKLGQTNKTGTLIRGK